MVIERSEEVPAIILMELPAGRTPRSPPLVGGEKGAS
jgi:hypothetical protein